MRGIVLTLAVAVCLFAENRIANPGFEVGEVGQPPQRWSVPEVVVKAGFGVTVVEDGCRTGRCALMTGVENPPEQMFGNVIQSLPAGDLRLRRIRYSAAVRVEGDNTRAQMWLRLDRADRSMAFLENMAQSPIRSSEWKTYTIETEVETDVERIVLGVMLFGAGKAWVDDVSLEAVGEIQRDKVEPPRPLTTQGLRNLTAFSKLYGYVRFFHPSDQAAKAEWDRFAIDAVRTIEDATTIEDLAARLRKEFGPLAPAVQVYVTSSGPKAGTLPKGPQIVRNKHFGAGLPSSTLQGGMYKSDRKTDPATEGKSPEMFTAELVPGLSASIPLELYSEGGRTLPEAPVPALQPPVQRSASDRGTRLAGVIIAWNIFQHFYPYFDVVKTDWAAELPKALKSAATDADAEAFHKTLRLLVASLKDGHGSVSKPAMTARLLPPVTLDWVERQLLVTRVHKDGPAGIAAGDRVVSIDGKAVEQYAAEARALISGATEGWINYRLAGELSTCAPGSKTMQLELEPFGKTERASVTLPCGPMRFNQLDMFTETRPADVLKEVEPGYYCLDLTRATEAQWKEAVPVLAKAKGIVFDMRGYPGRPGIQALAHLTRETIRCARWNVPTPEKPDRIGVTFNESGWDVAPAQPYFEAPRAFLTNGRAISYAETVMGIVENYKLGEVVGSPTAGTNGNVNPFKLPGGFVISWTGMKVLKHDKSQHHGIGILPTVPVSRTRKGVAEGKDEVLLKALEVLKAKA